MTLITAVTETINFSSTFESLQYKQKKKHCKIKLQNFGGTNKEYYGSFESGLLWITAQSLLLLLPKYVAF